MEITKREILFSIVIISIMIGIGIPISNKVIDAALNKSMSITSAVKVSDEEKFGYIARTDVGDFIAEGVLIARDSISIPDIKGHYMSIEKVKERYTMHTQVHTVSNGKGGTTTYTTHYWSWDPVDRWKWQSDSVNFLGAEFALKETKYRPYRKENCIIKESSHVRYVYYTAPTRVKGVMLGSAKEKAYSNLCFRSGETIEKIVKRAENRVNGAGVGFWIFWAILTAFIIFGFYYAENNWLED